MSQQPPPILSAARIALAIKRLKEERPDTGILASEPIAITGIGCRFPGNVHSPEECWRIFAEGIDVITEVPPDRWPASEYFHPDPAVPGKTTSRWGGFLANADLFDPVAFGISPREAAGMDPQQRLVLETAWDAIQDSGCAPESLAGTRTGVFVGAGSSDYERLALEDSLAINANTCTGVYRSVISGRLSFLLDLRGPSVCVDTACSSSLVAIHTACQSLRSGESDMAVAGGVTLHLLPEHYVGLARLGMLSPDGRCKTFDAGANGFVPSEGCGLIVLKRLSDALTDGDRVYAVIRGSAINQDGRTNSLTAPSGLAQQEVVSAALRNAQVLPSSISYVETHGTGTSLGDPIEVEALAAVLGAVEDQGPSCALGAAKSNFGHLESAAGVLGLIKVALSLHHETIPANLHFEKLNPHISLAGTRFSIPTQAQAWPRGQTPRFAGVSSFGFSGTNAHIVLEEAPRVPVRRSRRPWESTSLLAISARTRSALEETAREYRNFLNGTGRQLALPDICHAAALRSSHYEERLALTADSHEELRSLIDEFLEGRRRAGISYGRAAANAGSLVFVCSGQGSQWPAMGMSLLRQNATFRAALEECNDWIQRWAGWSLIEQLSHADAQSNLAQTEYAQPAIFAIEVALARLLASWGIQPGAVIGHSAGEVAAAHIAGALSLGEAARIVVHRGRLMQAATGRGKMLAVRLAADAVFHELTACGDAVSIAAINSPQSTVVSGDVEWIERLAAKWLAQGTGCVMMPVNYAFHSAQMEPFSHELVKVLGTVETERATVPVISTVSGEAARGEEFEAAYWGRNIRRTVMFERAIKSATKLGFSHFVEIGPHPVLLAAIGECLGEEKTPGVLIPTLSRKQDDVRAMLSAAGALHTAGHPVSWQAIYGTPAPPVRLPAYPYERRRFWLEGRRPSERNAIHPLLGKRLRSPSLDAQVFETQLDTRTLPYLADHKIEGRVLVPLTTFLEMALQATVQIYGRGRALADVTVVAPLTLEPDTCVSVQIQLGDDKFEIFSLQGEAWTLHVEGRINGNNAAPVTREIAPAGDDSAPEAHYQKLVQSGIDFGPAFRTVRAVWLGWDEAWVHARLQDSERHDASLYLIHPALLDGCLQAVVGAARDRFNGPILPFTLDSFESYAAGCEEVWAHAKLRPSTGELLAADIEVRRAGGALVARVSGLRLKRRSVVDSNIYSIEWQRQERGRGLQPVRDFSWALVSAASPDGAVSSPDAAALGRELRARGQRVLFADASQALPHPVDHVVLFGELDVAGVLRSLQQLVHQTSPDRRQVWLVTRGAVSVGSGDACEGLRYAPLWGLLRTAALEHPELRCARADLDFHFADYAALAEELLEWDGEEEIAFRSGARYVRRLRRNSTRDLQPVRWSTTARGSLENLVLEPLERRAPRPGEVEVEVEASALNFRDVLNVLGQYPGDAGDPGVEFCGRITRVGSEVHAYRPGDRVMGLAFPAMASFVTTPAALVVSAPTGWGPVESASVPNAFLTAWHCLIHVARLQAGERVMIHAGSGGVGLAAIQIAKHAGAEIFATAGNDDKRAYLQSLGIEHVFDSRSDDFARQIARITNGNGVDVILNSLTGDLIAAGFACLAERGRFVEIGKNGIWTKEQVAALGRCVEYFVIDLMDVIESDPALIQSELTAIRDAFESGVFTPLPATVFDFSAAPAAFLQMTQTRHIGKLVLRHATALHIASRATYLITGGLGAIGMQAAQWLAARGARHLVLVGRNKPDPQAAESIEEMRVEVRECDVAQRAQIEAVICDIRRKMPPLAGVFHAAGVLDDGVLIQQTPERLSAVMAPKIAGAWNLHELTSDVPLDFFILCSSVSSVFGSPGQAGYAAGNAYLDALAHFRRARGLPALSVNWGAWAGAGMAARVEQQGRRRVLPGLEAMHGQDCLEAFNQAASSRHAQVVIAAIDWNRFKVSSLTADATPGGEKAAISSSPENFAERLNATPPANRRKVLLDFLREQAVQILGLNPSHVFDEHQPLLKMGLDSLMAIEFRNRLSAALQRPFSATLLFDYPTTAALAGFLEGNHEVVEEEPDAVLELVAGLSDAEAEELLRQELERG